MSDPTRADKSCAVIALGKDVKIDTKADTVTLKVTDDSATNKNGINILDEASNKLEATGKSTLKIKDATRDTKLFEIGNDAIAGQNLVESVKAEIAKLPEKVTLDDEKAITDARKHYDDLTSEQKTSVGSIEKLTNAEDAIKALKDKEKADAKKDLDDAITQAKAKKADVVTSADGTNVEPSKTWVTSGVMDTFNDAIQTAENASKASDATVQTLTDAKTTLNNAITAFNPQAGTK